MAKRVARAALLVAGNSISSLPNHHFRSNKSFAFSSSSSEPKKINTKVNFSISNSSDDDEEDDDNRPKSAQESAKTRNPPPPYDPFTKNPIIEEPKDPKNLQEIFHKMKTDGLLSNAAKMFDALSKEGLTHEALQLFAQINDKGHIPDVVAHTAVIKAYADAGRSKEAHKVYLRMLASGVAPNAYTYSVLVKGLAVDPKLVGSAKALLLEMMGKGLKPNAGTYVAVFEALVRDDKVDEARELLVQLEAKGFVPYEKDVREVLLEGKGGRGPLFWTLVNILFDK